RQAQTGEESRSRSFSGSLYGVTRYGVGYSRHAAFACVVMDVIIGRPAGSDPGQRHWGVTGRGGLTAGGGSARGPRDGEQQHEVILAGAVSARRIERIRPGVVEAANLGVRTGGRIVPLGGHGAAERAQVDREGLRAGARGRLVSEPQSAIAGVCSG